MNEQYHPIRTWIRNIIRFELFYRLFIILIVYPLSNWLINLYITTNTVHSSLSNFSMFFDFLSIPRHSRDGSDLGQRHLHHRL